MSGGPFAIEEARRGDATVVIVHGELDLEYAGELSGRLAELRERGDAVVLDLDHLDFIDSSGLRVLLQAVQDSQEHAWSFHVTKGSPAVGRLLRGAGLEGRLPTVDPPA